jgi:hypothetical protein
MRGFGVVGLSAKDRMLKGSAYLEAVGKLCRRCGKRQVWPHGHMVVAMAFVPGRDETVTDSKFLILRKNCAMSSS